MNDANKIETVYMAQPSYVYKEALVIGTTIFNSNTASNLYKFNAAIEKISQFESVYRELNFENEAILEIAQDIIENAILLGKEVTISKTGDNEALIYTAYNGDFKNIIIDDEGNIEFLFISSNRSDSYNEFFPFIGAIDAQELAGKL